MRRHLLVTVSSDQAAMHGVRFVCDFLRDRRGLALTLFYTAPRPPAVWEHERNFESLAEYDRRAHDNREQGRAALDAGAALLREAGYAAGNVDAKLILREMSTAEDILRECEQGLYDAVVLGRRGQQGLEALVEQSVTRDLVERAFIAPLWVCRRFEKGRQGVLLCLDGSDASLRMADHVGFMLRAEPQHAITLFTVLGPGPLGPGDPEQLFGGAMEILAENGVEPGRVETRTVKGTAPARAILAEADRGRYAVVATGRTGRGRGLLRRVFMGSATQALLRELDGAALWIRT
jgi:nucleotide-binding universal stress UspA family protein